MKKRNIIPLLRLRTTTVSILILFLFTCTESWFFLIFLEQATRHDQDYPESVDAIICLAGGKGRIREALDFLNKGISQRLLISGTGKESSLTTILKPYQESYPLPLEAISSENTSINTLGNALESKKYIQAEGIHRIILITSGYHMPRSLYIFSRVLGDKVKIYPYRTFVEYEIDSGGLPSWSSLRQLLYEFFKYQVVPIQLLFV